MDGMIKGSRRHTALSFHPPRGREQLCLDIHAFWLPPNYYYYYLVGFFRVVEHSALHTLDRANHLFALLDMSLIHNIFDDDGTIQQ